MTDQAKYINASSQANKRVYEQRYTRHNRVSRSSEILPEIASIDRVYDIVSDEAYIVIASPGIASLTAGIRGASTESTCIIMQNDEMCTIIKYAGIEMIHERFTGIEKPLVDTFTGIETLFEDTFTGIETLFEDTFTGIEKLFEDTFTGIEKLFEDTFIGMEKLFEDTFAGIEKIYLLGKSYD